MEKKRKVLLIISWVLFGLTSSLIVVESCIPSSASGEHSLSFSTFAAKIINTFSKPKKVNSVNPVSLKVRNNDPKALLDDVEVSIVENNKAVVGTTKLFTYELEYSNEQADIYNSDVSLNCISSPGENSFTSNITSSIKNGTIRIIPTKVGHYSFELKDKANNTQKFEFDATNRIETKRIESNVFSLNLDQGEYKYFSYAFTFGNLERTDTSTDHYLQRFYNRDLTSFTSSDESVFTISNGGLIKGVSHGTANLLFKGENVCSISVSDNVFMSNVDHISLSTSSTSISPLDFDYLYGSQLEVHYYDSFNNEINCNEPVRFTSGDYLIAMVDNDHQEIIDGELTSVDGGFVSGYRNYGKTSIHVELCSNPSINSSIEFESQVVNPTSATISAKCDNQVLSASSQNNVVAGKTISLSKIYLPLNASNTELVVEVSDSSILEVQNNNTNNPSINLLKAGNCSLSVYMPTIGETSKVTYSLSISSPKAIEDKDMNSFHQVIRKGAGHFALFFIDAIFGFIAFSLTFDLCKKKWWISLLINAGLLLFAGFALAGISELIQSIPSLNRGSSWADVLIDFLGFLSATIVCGVVFLTIYLLKNKKKKPKN